MIQADPRPNRQARASAKIHRRYASFSATQRRIADVILQRPDDASFFTAAELADEAGVSESSVVRFAQSIGFSGYPEMRREMQADFRIRADYRRVLASRERPADGPAAAIDEIAARDATLVRDTAARLDLDVLGRCAERILRADQVFVVGHRASYALAAYLASTLRQGIGVGLPLAFGSGMALEVVAAAKPHDVLVAVSITPYAPQTLALLLAARQRGISRIVLTDDPRGEPARLADEVLLFAAEIQTFTSSYVGAMTLTHILLGAVRHRDPQRAEQFRGQAASLYDIVQGVDEMAESGGDCAAGVGAAQ